jgi:hypothetical protein
MARTARWASAALSPLHQPGGLPQRALGRVSHDGIEDRAAVRSHDPLSWPPKEAPSVPLEPLVVSPPLPATPGRVRAAEDFPAPRFHNRHLRPSERQPLQRHWLGGGDEESVQRQAGHLPARALQPF